VTFLFTDLEGSTRLWEEQPDAMRDALARHDQILRDAVEKYEGQVVKTTGDGLHAAFGTAHDAVAASIEAQRGLDAEPWTLPDPLLVRMCIHTGEADLREGDYFGTAVNRAARVSAAAHGGQIIVSHATEELVRDHLPAVVTLEDLGEHHLRDLARPERVFQVQAPGLIRDFPPLRSLEAFPGNLPARQTSFVGRDKELGKIADALRSAPLVTLTGVGGVGKTRLAVQVAAQVLPHYPDGAWLCELATADSPDTLIQVVASALAVPSRSGMDQAQAVVEYLRAKHLLLVLDNCEHLLDPAGDLADRIVETCPNVRLLATSREGLAVDGEQVFPLRSLGLPDAGANTDAIEATEAVQLFVERAPVVHYAHYVHRARVGLAQTTEREGRTPDPAFRCSRTICVTVSRGYRGGTPTWNWRSRALPAAPPRGAARLPEMGRPRRCRHGPRSSRPHHR
jgi:class 3 adenylate cyclase